MRVFLVAVIVIIIWPSFASGQETEAAAWWAAADFWKVAAPFFGAFLGFFGATFVNDWLHRRREREARRQMIVGVALALKGEVLAAAITYDRNRTHLESMFTNYSGEELAKKEDSKTIVRIIPKISNAIFVANIGRIDLLADSEIIADIAQFYSITESIEDRMDAENVAIVAKKAAGMNLISGDRARDIARKLQELADRTK